MKLWKKAENRTFFFTATDVFALAILVAGVLLCGFFSIEQKTPKEEPLPTIGVLEGVGFTVESPNPVVAENGTARFSIRFAEGYFFSSCSDGTFADGVLTVNAESAVSKSVTVEAAGIFPLTVADTVCGSAEVLSAETLPGDDLLPDGYYRSDRSVTLQLSAAEHYLCEGVKVGNTVYTAKNDGTVILYPGKSGETLELLFLGEPVSVRLGSNRLGSITDLSGSEVFRYGESLNLKAEYDSSTQMFLGFSEGGYLKDGGTLLTEQETYRGVLTGDAEIYANFQAKRCYTLCYGEAEGMVSQQYSPGETVTLPLYGETFEKEGYAAIGFAEVYADGSMAEALGEEGFHSFGAAFLMPKNDVTLRVVYKACTDLSLLSYTVSRSTVTLQGLSAEGKKARLTELVLPDEIEGKPVTVLAKEAFRGNTTLQTVYLPAHLRQILDGAFADCVALLSVTFPETLTVLRESAFDGCRSFREMRVLASLDKVYDVDYDSALADKYLRLLETEGTGKRLLLVGGSGLSFGMDSAMLEEAYPDYTVINFSTSVYYGIRPLLSLLEQHVHEGDVLVFALEFRSYMYGEEADTMTNWQYLESNYDMLSDIDLRDNRLLLNTYLPYLKSKRAYLSDGKKKYNSLVYSRASFNLYGDLSAVRPGQTEPMESNLPYTDALTDEGLAYLRKAFTALRKNGAEICFTYPAMALPEGCSDAEIERAEAQFETRLREVISEELCPQISSLLDAYYPYTEIYDTKYHLSTAGAKKRTKLLIRDLAPLLENLGKEN